MTELRKKLKSYNACHGALVWIGDRTPYQAWRQCERGDWLLWTAKRLGVQHELVVQAACDCAELSLSHAREGEDRARLAIEEAKHWIKGRSRLSRVGLLNLQWTTMRTGSSYSSWANAAAANVIGVIVTPWAYCAEAAVTAACYAIDGDNPGPARVRCAKLVRKRIPWRLVRDLAL